MATLLEGEGGLGGVRVVVSRGGCALLEYLWISGKASVSVLLLLFTVFTSFEMYTQISFLSRSPSIHPFSKYYEKDHQPPAQKHTLKPRMLAESESFPPHGDGRRSVWGSKTSSVDRIREIETKRERVNASTTSKDLIKYSWHEMHPHDTHTHFRGVVQRFRERTISSYISPSPKSRVWWTLNFYIYIYSPFLPIWLTHTQRRFSEN